VTKLKKIKREKYYKFSITGVGGVINPKDYKIILKQELIP